MLAPWECDRRGEKQFPRPPPLGGQGAPATRTPQTPGFAPLGKTAWLGAGEGSRLPKSQSQGAELPAKETQHFVIGAASPPPHHSSRTMRH